MIKDQLIFSDSNPITSNHKVYGQSLLPGLAYIDMLFQCFRKHGYRFDELEMKNLTIHNPLIVNKESKVILSILVKENRPGSWKVEIEGKKLYATAEMLQTEGYKNFDTLDIASLKKGAEETYPIADIYERYRARDMVHQGFIKAEGNIYKLAEGLLFNGFLGKEARPTADQFIFHPALIDGSAVAMMRLFDSVVKEEENLFLPLFYESFRASALINKNSNAFLPVSSIRRKNDIISFSIYFFDESGKKIGELINLTTKRVRNGLGDATIETSPILQQNEAISVSIHFFDEAGKKIGELTNISAKLFSEGKVTSIEAPKEGRSEITQEAAGQKASGQGPAGQGAVAFLKELLGNHLNIDKNSIGANTEYYHMGFDSVSLLHLAVIIGDKIGKELPPTLLFEYPNISLLADHLTHTYAETFV
jgi:bacillaene polyketide synthase PksM/BaeM